MNRYKYLTSPTTQNSTKVKLWNDKMAIGTFIVIRGTFCGNQRDLRINVQSFNELVLDADVEVKLTLNMCIHGTQTTVGLIETHSYDALAKMQATWTVKYTVASPLATPTRLGGLSATALLVDISDGHFVVQLLNYSYCDKLVAIGPAPSNSPNKRFKFAKTIVPAPMEPAQAAPNGSQAKK